MKEFDAIIVGAGQAGSPLAHNLADQDWQVALIEREHLGGSCINYGCTPTKTLIASARAAQAAREAGRYGVSTGEVEVDLTKVMRRKDEVVESWWQGQQEHADKRPSLELFRGTGTFTGSRSVAVNGEVLTAPKVFVNTGTRPAIPPIDGVDNVPYLTNKSILELEELPAHLMILGAGPVGLEFGQIFRHFGSKVTVIEVEDQILPMEDKGTATTLQDSLAADGLEFHLSSYCTQMRRLPDGDIQLSLENGSDDSAFELKGSHLLLATGRTPNTDDLNLEVAGIHHSEGWIEVDSYLETNVEGVFALGDVTGGPAFTHISYNDFRVALHNLLHEERVSIEGRIVPYAVFTDPELGRVGMTEREAVNKNYDIKIGEIPMSWVARAIESDRTEGMMMVVINAEDDRLLGAAVLGWNGAELVQTLMALLMADAPWTTFYQEIYIHPTFTEGFFTLMDNVE